MDKISVAESVLSYVEKNLGGDLTLEKIAKELNYSKFYIERTFKDHTGLSLYKYIRSRRLNEAARRLVETRQPIIDIAFGSGYRSQQAFTQAFRDEYVCTPQEYRKIGRFFPKQDRIRLDVSSRLFMEGRKAA